MTARLIMTKKKMTIETFELEDENDLSNAPDWVKDCIELGTVQEAPFLVDSLVKYGIFKSKTDARNMMKSKGLSVFCYEGPDEDALEYKGPYKTIDGKDVECLSDSDSLVTDPNTRWTFIPGDLVRVGKRKFFKIK
jgi:hypothetical protein